MKCLFCGGSTDFMTTLKNVCLSCGDKLQAQGVMVMSVEQYRNMEKRVSDVALVLDGKDENNKKKETCQKNL